MKVAVVGWLRSADTPLPHIMVAPNGNWLITDYKEVPTTRIDLGSRRQTKIGTEVVLRDHKVVTEEFHVTTLEINTGQLCKASCSCGFSKLFDRGVDAERCADSHMAQFPDGDIVRIKNGKTIKPTAKTANPGRPSGGFNTDGG